MPQFGLSIPDSVPGVPPGLLWPGNGWEDQEGFEEEVRKLAGLFVKNFKEYEGKCPAEVLAAGPRVV